MKWNLVSNGNPTDDFECWGSDGKISWKTYYDTNMKYWCSIYSDQKILTPIFWMRIPKPRLPNETNVNI